MPKVNHSAVNKLPSVTQRMWEVAFEDLQHERGLLAIVRDNSSATAADVSGRENAVRVREGICNTIDFLISNKEDIEAVIKARNKSR